jgi:hypothetical protein
VFKVRRVALALPLVALALAGCQKDVRTVVRSHCPAVAIPNYVGDVTLFNPVDSREASAIDVTASMIDLKGVCGETANDLTTNVSFTIAAQRRNAGPARSVTFPFFVSMVQAGNLVVSKQIGSVTVNFADGQLRAQASGAAVAHVTRAATTLPPEIQAQVSRKRKAGDADAAIDPLADPEVKAAIRSTSFEVLAGFQLDDAALAYNVTK